MGLSKLPRVGPDLHKVRKTENHDANKGLISNKAFIAACERGGVTPNLRQASKYRQGRGMAYLNR